MKVIIAGGRDFQNRELLLEGVETYQRNFGKIKEVVCGMADGADLLGYEYACCVDLPVKKFPADWVKFGRSAGPIRNAEMADYADGLIAFWDGKSKGTKNMITQAKAADIEKIIIVNY